MGHGYDTCMASTSPECTIPNCICSFFHCLQFYAQLCKLIQLLSTYQLPQSRLYYFSKEEYKQRLIAHKLTSQFALGTNPIIVLLISCAASYPKTCMDIQPVLFQLASHLINPQLINSTTIFSVDISLFICLLPKSKV